jgi:GR25 family glycosyltransferase involved in LPS biosynthesis
MGRISRSAYIVHLPTASRLGPLVDQIAEQGLSPVLVEGFDGRGLDDVGAFRQYDAAITRWHIGRDMTGPEIGCAVGHLRAYWKAYAGDKAPWVAIFEDDARLLDGALQCLDEIAQCLSEEVPIVLSLYSDAPRLTLSLASMRSLDCPGHSDLYVAQSMTPPSFAMAYLMNRPALELAASRESVEGVADWPAWAERCQFWVVQPWLARPDQLEPSLIQSSRTDLGIETSAGSSSRHAFRRTRVAMRQLQPSGLWAASRYYGGPRELWKSYYRPRLLRVRSSLRLPWFGTRSSDQVQLR